MAGDNSKINELATEAGDDTTNQLEILSMDLVPTDEELEMDANTFSLDEQEGDEHNIATLRSDIRSKDERISDLQFDIEQLRSRWSGLEKEIQAREELTEILQTDLKAAHKSLAAKDKLLTRNERDLADLSSKLEATQAAREQADAEREDARRSADEFEGQIDEQRRRISELESEVEIAAAAAIPADATLQREIETARIKIADLNTYIDGRRSDWQRQITEIETLKARLETQQAEITRLEGVIDDYHRVERAANEQLIEQQAGEIAGDRDRIREIQSALERSEAYADELRRKLSDTEVASESFVGREGQLEDALTSARETITDLEARLQAEQTSSADLQEMVRDLETRVDSESGGLRKTLEELEADLDESRTINEQLTSDLIDSNAFRQALEDQLESIGESGSEQVEKLEKEVARLKLLMDDYERKISNKDNAISALLNELANKSRTLDSISEIESVIHEIDDRMSERIDDRVAQGRERPTRLLVGSIDGQEVRFPLFKNRLTIGRTVQNDIQLRAQFISRRHAVIVTDDDGTKIVDWGSKNGVYVNNARISEQFLKSGDQVMIGMAEFTYEELPRRPSE